MRSVFPIALLALVPLAGQTEKSTKELDVAADRVWTDTGVDCQPGETVRITATGTLQYLGAKEIGPEGLPRGFRDLLRIMPFNEAGRGALLARIGDSDAARPLLVGPRREIKAAAKGRLFLGVNQPSNESATGKFQVKIEREGTPVSPDASAPPPAIAKVTQEMLDGLPLRVVDAAGTQGDRVNFLIVGSADKVRSALQNAGWVGVDRSVKDALLRGVFASLSKQAYVTLPMSELLMFGRPQDYGYAQADPIAVVAARHHFRIWKAPFELAGQTVWIGAGTHDIGFDRDQRNGKITHKIDPEVDKERDYIGRSLFETGQVAMLDYATPANPIKEAKTAHGATFTSDGRTLVVYLQPELNNFSARFGDLFCSILRKTNPDTGEWGACKQYIENPGKEDLDLPPIAAKYRVLIVPGIMSSCVSDTPAFMEGQKYLREKYGMTVDLLGVPNDSSEDNARMIAQYLKEKTKDDARKFIVLGYSKGTPDVQVALAQEGVAPFVAAFISVAGASGGSPIADAIPGLVEKWVKQYNVGNCQGNVGKGFQSLRRDIRQAFLASFPNPFVPTYSLVAISDETTTSKALQQAWKLLSVFDPTHDGQLTKFDAIIPGAKFLGSARADHLAVALPFDKAADETIRKAMDRARYPRAALLEALVRFVVQDLEEAKPFAPRP